jgi:hypothetical protein
LSSVVTPPQPVDQDEEDEHYLPQIDHAELEQVLHAVDRVVQRIAQHPRFKARQQGRKVRRLQARGRLHGAAHKQHAKACGKHDRRDEHVTQLKVDSGECQKQRRRQRQVEDDLLQAIQRFGLEELPPLQEQAQRKQQEDGQHFGECSDIGHGDNLACRLTLVVNGLYLTSPRPAAHLILRRND